MGNASNPPTGLLTVGEAAPINRDVTYAQLALLCSTTTPCRRGLLLRLRSRQLKPEMLETSDATAIRYLNQPFAPVFIPNRIGEKRNGSGESFQ